MTWATARHLARPAIILGALLLILLAPLLHPAAITAQGGSTYTVQAGENLFRIALRYNLTVEALAAANGITDPTHIYAGQVLVIPDGSAAVPAPAQPAPAPVEAAPAAAPAASPVYHTVQPGESLASIARLYGVNWTEIASLNGIGSPNTIFAGQQLLIPGTSAPGTAAVAPPVEVQPAAPAPLEAAPAPAVPAGGTTHVVQPGENLAAIGRIYGVSWPAIAGANNITDPNHIYSGQTLVIPTADTGQGAYMQPQTWNPLAIAAPTLTTGKQVVVDLSDQMVYAYENGALVRSTLVSTGLPMTPTVQGDYRIYVKYDSQLMTGPGYYLPGVPYVMYFYEGYSLHGTYWHNNFGQPMSHGCVNMPTPEAQWFYTWTEIGTPVHVQW